MLLLLRPYQSASIDRARALLRGGVRRLVIAAPTGAGKTCIAARIVALAYDRNSRVVFVAHRRELISQTFRKLVDASVPESAIGVLMARDPRTRPGAPVQVVSIATIVHREPPPADLVIIDECHRSLSPSYLTLIEHYSQSGAAVIGLSATPYRADGSGLGDVYEALELVASPRELIDEGFLVEPRTFSAAPGGLPDLTGVHTRGGDYVEHELSAAMMRGGLVGNIVEHWKRLADGQRTVAFAASVEHSRSIAAAFVVTGVAAEHLDGSTPTAERDAILARLESGETLVVSNCGVLCEGWDMPSVKVCILARPTKSLGLYLQQAGRILRPWNGVRALILDHAGNALRHGLPQDDRHFTLAGAAAAKGGASAAPTRACPACDAVVRIGAPQCPECHVEFERKAVPKIDAPGELVEVSGLAGAMQVEAERRRAAGLCTAKMAEQLRKRGLRFEGVTLRDAQVAMAAIRRNEWRTPAWLYTDPRFQRSGAPTPSESVQAVRDRLAMRSALHQRTETPPSTALRDRIGEARRAAKRYLGLNGARRR